MSATLSDNDTDAYDPVGDGITDPLIGEAHKRFKRCEDWYATAYARTQEDYKFANGDSDNNYQWPDRIWDIRYAQERPSLTINKVRQHNLQIINDAKQKKSGIKYRPIGDGATVWAANTFEGVARHIEDVSNATMHRGLAIEFQVHSGLGYTRIVTDYEHDKTFDQEIYIRSVPDPWSCYLDPDHVELDASDARYGFIFADRPRDQVEAEDPEHKGKLSARNAVDGAEIGWQREKTIRECEYYWIEEEEDELIGSFAGVTILRSQANPQIIKAWEAEAEQRNEDLRKRRVVRKQLKWAKIIGSIVVEEHDCPGSSIPIVPWIGEKTIIQDQLDLKGHTRTLKDAQRMLNYNRSASVEFGALQSKTPYVGPFETYERFESYWKTANTENHAYLPYASRDDVGNPLEKPERQQPPASAPAFLDGSNAAERDMMLASGQYEAELGAPSNEVSGRAINERQRQGDRATYHFIDNQAIAIRREGQIILELIPQVYDTRRVKRVLGDDGTEAHVVIDPSSPAAYQALGADIIFNPTIGKYAVVADVGPDFATQRQEAFNAIVQVLVQAPQLIPMIGDLLFKSADFPLADEIAERLKPGLQPEAQAAITELQKQLRAANQLLGETMQSLTEERLKVKAKDSDNTIKAYEADTHRLQAVQQMIPTDPNAMAALVAETVRQALQDNLGPIVGHLAKAVGVDTSEQGPPGAQGHLPARVPDVGQQAATPGGM